MPPIVHEGLRSRGQPLDAATLAFFEPRFGHDFSSVRVHTDARAAQSAAAVNALAYTVGREVVFQPGQFAPHTNAGRMLLAHELAHVVQQAPGADTSSLRHFQVSQPDDAFEREADVVAANILESGAAAHGDITAAGPEGAWLQRQPAPAPAGNQEDAFPVVNVELNLNPASPQRCCSCGTPPCVAHLGPARAGDPTAQNGVNLVASLLHTIESSSRSLDYGFVQTMQTRRCLEHLPAAGGGWDMIDNQPAGTIDVFGACATCTTPIVRGDGIPEVVYADAPGLALGGSRIGAPAFGNQLVQRANFSTWVIAREPRKPWQRISDPVRWHSLSWIRRDGAGNWELNPGQNVIGPGWARFGPGCPP